LGLVESISDETIRRTLKNKLKACKPWQKQQWCIPQGGAEFVWRMEDVRDLYAQPYDPLRPVVVFDETNKQRIQEVPIPWPPQAGQPQPYDSEYTRNGVANLFRLVEPLARWRRVEVTAQRTKNDFAQQMKTLVEVHYRQAEVIHVVLDNLNTHTPDSYA